MQVFWKTADLNSSERKTIFHHHCFNPLLLGIRGWELAYPSGMASPKTPSPVLLSLWQFLFWQHETFGNRSYLHYNLCCFPVFPCSVLSITAAIFEISGYLKLGILRE